MNHFVVSKGFDYRRFLFSPSPSSSKENRVEEMLESSHSPSSWCKEFNCSTFTFNHNLHQKKDIPCKEDIWLTWESPVKSWAATDVIIKRWINKWVETFCRSLYFQRCLPLKDSSSTSVELWGDIKMFVKHFFIAVTSLHMFQANKPELPSASSCFLTHSCNVSELQGGEMEELKLILGYL